MTAVDVLMRVDHGIVGVIFTDDHVDIVLHAKDPLTKQTVDLMLSNNQAARLIHHLSEALSESMDAQGEDR